MGPLQLAGTVQEATGQNVASAYGGQGYTGEEPRKAMEGQGMKLEVVKLAEAKKGFVLLPRRWVVERSFGWASRFRRLARDYERLSGGVEQFHSLVFAILMLIKPPPHL